MRQGVFSGLFLQDFPLVATLQNFQKICGEGVLAKFAIARLYGHFGSRSLLQNVVLCWHFKCILIRR